MIEYKHVTGDEFYTLLHLRLVQYAAAIFGNRPGESNVRLNAANILQQIRRLDNSYQFFKGDWWGYGYNAVSNGQTEWINPDVEIVRAMPGFRKHMESERFLNLLLFSITGGVFVVHLLTIDPVKGSIASDLKTTYSLINLLNSKIKSNQQIITVEFHFQGTPKPVYFQVDTYHMGGSAHYYTGHQLAKYYTDLIDDHARKMKGTASVNIVSNSTPDITLTQEQIASIKEQHLMDLVNDNVEYEKYVANFYKRRPVATHFIPDNEFINNEIATFKKGSQSLFEVTFHVNDQLSVTPYSPGRAGTQAYNYLVKGHNLPVSRLIKDAREECQRINNELLRKHGRKTASTELNDDFDLTVIHAIRMGVGFALYIKFLRGLPIEGSAKTDQTVPTPDQALKLLKPEVHSLFEKAEGKIPDKVASWRTSGSKITCAAFCDLMFDMGWFISKDTRIKSASSFALKRYGIVIDNQLKTAKDPDRNFHKTRLKKHFQ